MALIERLMHDPSEPESKWIAVHQFFAALTELLLGNLSAAQIQSFYGMSAADLADWNALAATIPLAGQTAERAFWVEHLHSVFLLAETRVPSFATPAETRARLGI